MRRCHDSLDEFFKHLEGGGVLFATRFVREEAGIVVRDDNQNEVALSPHLSKRQLYARWCYDRGWMVEYKSQARSMYESRDKFRSRVHDDKVEAPLWPTGSEGKPILSWQVFLHYWNTKFPYIKIWKRGADTCTDCLVLTNKCNAVQNRQTQARTNTGETGGSEEIDEDEDDKGVNQEMVREKLAEYESVVEELKVHVKHYEMQRKMANDVQKLAIDNITNLLPSLHRRQVLIIDMGENLAIPNFAADQPGDTYYLSPLTIYLFGVAFKESEKVTQMNAYVWPEYEANHGAHNICSCLLKDFKNRQWFQRPNLGGLFIIANNCGGQNKNKHVVWFLMWLVEAGHFPKATLLFLVKGHTKNVCDRLFNLVKLNYSKKDIFTYDAMCENMNANQ